MTNDLPPGWATTTLGELFAPRRGKYTPNSTDRRAYLSLDGVESHTSRIAAWERSSDYSSQSSQLFAGDVAYARLRPYLNKVAVIDREALGSAEFIVLPRLPQVLPGFLCYRLLCHDFVTFADQHSTGDRPRLKWTQMRDFILRLPPLSEQERIVAAIEEHFSRLDAAESDLTAAYAKSAFLPSIVVPHLFSGRWPTRRLGELARVGSGATPKRSEVRYWAGGTIPWVTSGAVNDQSITSASELITEKALAETSVKLWPAGTVLVAMYGEGKTRGKAAVLEIESTCNQACAAIDYNRSLLNGEYLMAYLNSRYEANRSLSSGGVQPNLSLGIIKSMEIPIPSLTTQGTIALQAQDIAQQSDLVTEACAVARRRITALRRSILATAFSGQLAPQDPDDEPAPVLLERIAASRCAKAKRQRVGP